MTSRYLDIATTPAVAAAQAQYGSAAQWARMRARGASDAEGPKDQLGPAEIAFITARDGFYLASVSQSGWPYVQFRGGPAGFLAPVDATTLVFADLRGNRQYITTGNVRDNDRVSLFLMDYANRRRLKIFGRMALQDAQDDPALAQTLAQRLADAGAGGRVERIARVSVEAFDWNCPQHITPRFTPAEIDEAFAPVREEFAALERENERLRAALQAATKDRAGAAEDGV